MCRNKKGVFTYVETRFLAVVESSVMVLDWADRADDSSPPRPPRPESTASLTRPDASCTTEGGRHERHEHTL
jgi:hypothetical protein